MSATPVLKLSSLVITSLIIAIAIVVAVVFRESSTPSGHAPPLPQRCISPYAATPGYFRLPHTPFHCRRLLRSCQLHSVKAVTIVLGDRQRTGSGNEPPPCAT